MTRFGFRRAPLLLAAVVTLAAAAQAPAASRARLVVVPQDALLDSRVTITLTGVRARERVVVRASTRDAAGTRWLGSGVFRADSRGRVDVARARSVGGTYRGRDAMGVFWSMSPRGEAFYQPGDVSTFLVEAVARDRVVARAQIVRRARAPNVARSELTLAHDGLVGRFSAPADAACAPAVLLLGGSEGGISTDLIAGQLASHGYPVLQVAYFRAPGLPRELREIPLEYFRRALEWLAARPEADPAKLVVFGISRGGEVALLVGATFPELVGAVVAYTPSSVVNSSPRQDAPSWTLGGRPLPYVPLAEFGDTTPSDPAAIIPVERIDGPVLVVSGAQDNLWPSSLYADAIVRRRAESDKATTWVSSFEAGHGVGTAIPYVPVATFFGGSRAADAALRARAWPHVLRLLGSLR